MDQVISVGRGRPSSGRSDEVAGLPGPLDSGRLTFPVRCPTLIRCRLCSLVRAVPGRVTVLGRQDCERGYR
jgi:hypothetical protein